MPWEVREQDGKQCVFKIGGDSPIEGGCHDKRADAIKHVRALYANEPSMKYSVLTFADALMPDMFDDPNVKWVRAWRYSTWDHPKYGKVEITPSTGLQFKTYFDEGTLGREHLVNYDHGGDPAKGGKAAGKILAVDPREDGIYYQVKFTDTAKKEIDAGEWRYLSPEYDDWINPETGDVYEEMMFDLAVTNTPFFKGQPPLNFSELYELQTVTTNSSNTTVTPSKPKGGSEVDELLKQFAGTLGVTIADDATEEQVLKAAADLNDVIEPMRKAQSEGAKQRTFREAFPDEFKEMERLRKSRVEGEARSFAENYRRFTIKGQGDSEFKSTLGFSELVIDEITEAYKKFSDKTLAPSDLGKLLDLIGDKGIVDYSESGSTRTGFTDKNFNEDPKLAFSEAVLEVMNEDNLEYEKAISVAQMKFPDLYEAYQRAIPRI